MKYRFILLTVLLIAFVAALKAQCPEALNYFTVIRDAEGTPIVNTTLVMRFTIYDSSTTSVPVDQETFTTSTNAFGAIFVRPGNSLTDIYFPGINWANGVKYMQVEMQMNGTGPFVTMGTEEFASVPYALYADYAGKGGYPQHHIGEIYGGGVVFYVTDNGQHGLIADSADLGADTITWARIDTTLLNASLQGTGGGYVNTERIVVNQGAGNYAANLCANDSTGGYGDWFLPSASELILLYQQQQVVGNFSSTIYWSSTESAKTTATALNFSTGITTITAKAAEGNVRAIRAF